MNGKIALPGANDPHMARIAMQESARREIEEKLQHIQRELYVRLVLQLLQRCDEPDNDELVKLARFAHRASVQYGKAVGFLKENKPPAEQKPMTRTDPDGKQHHTLKAEAGKIVMKQPAGPS